MSQTNLNLEHLQGFQQWRAANSPAFTLLDYLYGVATFETAIACTALFWPDLVEYHEGIFLADGFSPETFAQWNEKLGDDLIAIERVMNHRHLGDMLRSAAEAGTDNLLFLGRTMAEMWECRAARLYPARHIVVTCEVENSSNDVVLTLYEAAMS